MHRVPGLKTTSRWKRRGLIVLVVLALVAGAWFVGPRRRLSESTPEIKTAYRNARPGVRFVGDEACTRCHSEIAATYRQHSMGRSLTPIEDASAELRGAAGSKDLFDWQGFTYSLENRDGRTFHHETRRDSAGKVIGDVEGEVKYVLGSGTRALAFLIQREDYLFQSPVTWYSQKKRWDLAPSFEGREAKFDRQTSAGCLVCHANRFDHVEGTEGRYRKPIFQGHAVGCERCHGPGELHVKNPAASAGDPNIINPRDLSPSLREAVCQQCHLIGTTTIARLGRDLRDFRPGLPLHKFVTVFVKSSEGADKHSNADHVEQMYQSRCFRASDGALGCISCHNPHEMPAPERKIVYYRKRCLECHSQKGCSMPEPARRLENADDSCIACHMPRAATSDVPHLSTTLHHIPRDGKAGLAQAPARKDAPVDDTKLAPFHRDLMDTEDRDEAGRDLGIALRQRGEDGAGKAIPLLKAWLARHPDDTLAKESEGLALWGLGRKTQGLAAFDSVLKNDAYREPSLEAAALIASELGRRDESIALWKRAITVDPWRSSFHAELAYDYTRVQKWSQAAAAARQALKLNTANRTARQALILATLRLGSRQEARAEFEILLQFNPGDRESLTQWFAALR